MTNKSKQLGKKFEYEIRNLLRETTGDNSFERVPDSGAFFGGANKIRAITARDDLVEIMSGDIICPPNWRWIVECKNYEDFSYHKLFIGNTFNLVDEFIEQVLTDAKTSNKEPLLFINLRRKKWIIPKKVKNDLKKLNIKIPQSNSVSFGILVGELKNNCDDIAHINHIFYTSSIENTEWRFFDVKNWLMYVNTRSIIK